MVRYIHYGHRSFNNDVFVPIRNARFFTKPIGGLWASREDAEFGWKDLCIRNDFRECNIENSFIFTLKENAKILEIHSHEDFLRIYELYGEKENPLPTCFNLLNFEAITKECDAIEYFLSEDGRLYHDLYGWDCDSILILNSDIVQMF